MPLLVPFPAGATTQWEPPAALIETVGYVPVGFLLFTSLNANRCQLAYRPFADRRAR
jgi:hypothetical protein